MKILEKARKQYDEIIRYLFVGIMTTIVSLASYYLCVSTVLDPKIAWQLQFANIISWVVAVTFAYVMSRKYVFKSGRKDWFREAETFYASRLATLMMDMAIMFGMVTVAGYNDKMAKLVVQVVVTVANYVLSKVFVFSAR